MADPVSGPPFPWPEKFAENSAKFPVEELWKYAKKYIAWSWDGTQIVASAKSHEELFQRLAELGIDCERVIFDYVDDLAVTSIIGSL